MIYIDLFIKDIKINYIGSKNVYGSFLMNLDFFSEKDNTILFSVVFTNYFSMRLVLGIDFNLNFAINYEDKSVLVKSTYIKNPFPRIEVLTLIRMINETFNKVVKNQYNQTFKNTLYLSSLFKRIYEIKTIVDKGFLFIGDY